MKKVFVTREFTKNPADFTKEEFIRMAIEDAEVAKVEYRKWSDEVAEQRYNKECEEHAKRREQRILDITNNSYKRYKREFYRQRWVEQEVAKIPKTLTKGYWHVGHDLTSLKWDLKPWDNGCHLVNLDRDLEHVFGYLYDEAIKNKYFLQCTGWSIVEDSSTEFKFHLSEELQNEWKEDERKLGEAISRFYAGSNWWGD